MRICDYCKSDKDVHTCSINLGTYAEIVNKTNNITTHVAMSGMLDACLSCRKELDKCIRECVNKLSITFPTSPQPALTTSNSHEDR